MKPLVRRRFVNTFVLGGGLVLLKPRLEQLWSHGLPIKFVAGRVVAISGNTLYASDRHGPLTLYPADGFECWKGKYAKDLTPLRAGDFFYAELESSPNGKLMVKKIWANIVSYGGQVARVDNKEFSMSVRHASLPDWTVRVRVDDETVINNGKGGPGDIRQARIVHVIGLQLGDGGVLARNMWVYENGVMTPR